jgi:uncharacterized protein YdhG (YjbR/CyaY superfamily)
MPSPATIDDYVSDTPEPGRARVIEIRDLCRRAAPHATEAIRWGHPTYLHPEGVILFMFSAHKAHASLAFTPSTKSAFADELAAYRTGKGTVAVPYDAPLPTALLRRMIQFRIREYEQSGVKWM